MGTLMRGLKSVYRNPARSLIVVFLLGVCLTFSMAMLAVRMAADSQVEEVKTRVGNYAEIKLGSQVFFNRFMSESGKSEGELQRESRTLSESEASAQRAEMLMSEQVTDDISRLGYVRTYDKFVTTNIDVPELENTSILPVFESGLAKQAASMGLDITKNTFAFTGNTDGASLSDFRDGKKELVEGGYYTYFDYLEANPVVLIERNLADKNDLEVGSTVEAQVKDKSGRDGKVELTVIGIYETREAENTNNPLGFNPYGNTFYTPLSVVQKLNNTAGYIDNASYYFDNVDSTGALFNDSASIAASDRYEITTDYADYQALADPLTKVGNTSSIGLWGSLGACVLILFLSMLLIVRGRVKELGVLKAVGAADRQILFQFGVEVVMLCLVAVLIASGLTAIFGQKLGDWLLKESNATVQAPSEVENGQNSGQAGMMNGAMNVLRGNSQGKYAPPSDAGNQIKVLFGSETFLYACLMLLGVCLLGMVIPVVWVARLRPAQVLRME
jgi:putative ABC transport system permease protein